MSFAAFYSQINEALKRRSPRALARLSEFDLSYVISPHQLKLPKGILHKAAAAIRAHYQLVQSQELQDSLLKQHPWLPQSGTRTDSVLMAYDFHTTAEGEAYLIEVNTNASAYLLSLLTYEAHGIQPTWDGKPAEQSLLDSFRRFAPSGRVAIVDDQIPQQKMLVEFLMYQDWFDRNGYEAHLVEGADLELYKGQLNDRTNSIQIDLVYNRLTDFDLSQPEHDGLRAAYCAQTCAVTPHPWAYLLLADKARLIELSDDSWLTLQSISEDEKKALRAVIIPTRNKEDYGSADDLWAQRKQLFFKPRASHGSKSVYRGSTVSRKVFERLLQEDIVVQNFVPAQDFPIGPDNQYLENWKFDLRFYVFRDQIQLAVARTYQGQVTNFSSPYGGLTAVEFI